MSDKDIERLRRAAIVGAHIARAYGHDYQAFFNSIPMAYDYDDEMKQLFNLVYNTVLEEMIRLDVDGLSLAELVKEKASKIMQQKIADGTMRRL